MNTPEVVDRTLTPDLSRLVIRSPCTMDWDSMEGNDRVRFCSKCNKHVFELASLTEQEAINLIEDKGEQLCGRIFRRSDGTIVTAECPPDPAKRSRPYQFTITTLICLITSSAALFAATPIIGRVVGPIVERWFPTPNSAGNPGATLMMGSMCYFDEDIRKADLQFAIEGILEDDPPLDERALYDSIPDVDLSHWIADQE